MRLVCLGNVVVDLVLEIGALPERGADLLAAGARSSAGGAFNVLAAAARQGLAAAYGGAHGTGPFGDLARAALAAEGIDVLQPPVPDRDTGVVVVLVDAEGERTFVTAPGAEASPPPGALAAIRPGPADIVGLSGYTLVHPASRAGLLAWLRAQPGASLAFQPGRLPAAPPGPPGSAGAPGAGGGPGLSHSPKPARPGAGAGGRPGLAGGPSPRRVAPGPPGSPGQPGLAGESSPGRAGPGLPGSAGRAGREPAPGLVVLDPGPLAGEIPEGVLAEVLGRTDWLTCNAREAELLSGEARPEAAARLLGERLPPGGGVIVRDGAAGCYLHGGGEQAAVPGFAVRAVDTTGAGDTHAGTFIAALARGAAPREAARLANAAAALSVTRRGPATAPSAAELAAFLASQPG